jgi:hypothetical protein
VAELQDEIVMLAGSGRMPGRLQRAWIGLPVTATVLVAPRCRQPLGRSVIVRNVFGQDFVSSTSTQRSRGFEGRLHLGLFHLGELRQIEFSHPFLRMHA